MAGLFKRFQKRIDETAVDTIGEVGESDELVQNNVYYEYLKGTIKEPDFQNQLIAIGVFFLVMVCLSYYRNSRVQQIKGEHTLNLQGLNDAFIFKDLFLAYLGAALLEPLLAICGSEKERIGPDLIMNMFALASIFWWLWLLTDAFDYNDVMQYYKYHVEIRNELATKKNSEYRYSWLKVQNPSATARSLRAREKRSTLAGCMKKDVALWFMLACIYAAWLPGPITHADVMHGYAVVFLWIIMHHNCRQATVWNSSYLVTFLCPSTALFPLEYCLPLMDVCDCVQDLAFVESYRDFVAQRTGVELIIES